MRLLPEQGNLLYGQIGRTIAPEPMGCFDSALLLSGALSQRRDSPVRRLGAYLAAQQVHCFAYERSQEQREAPYSCAAPSGLEMYAAEALFRQGLSRVLLKQACRAALQDAFCPGAGPALHLHPCSWNHAGREPFCQMESLPYASTKIQLLPLTDD